MRATRKDPPEKILAAAMKKYPQLLNLTAPQRDDRLQQDDRSYTDMGVDALRALSQPLNYMREVGKGNYLPTQAELEGSGVSAMEGVAALANPFDHVYATLAMAGVIDDPNYDNEYSSAALLGLVTGSAGEKVPRALEKTVKLLREEGVLTYSDIESVLRKNKNSAVIKELKAIKDKAIEFSKHADVITQKAYDDVVRKPGMNPWGYGSPAKIEKAVTNYMIESDPDALLKFTPERFDAGDFNKSMQNFAEEYLTSFRSVRASDPDNVVKYLTDPIGTGVGGRNLGAGLYQGTSASQVTFPTKTKYGDRDLQERPSYGGHLGVLRIAPEIGGPRASAAEIIKDLQIGELKGSTSASLDAREAMHNARVWPGFKTNPHIRASRSGTGVDLLEYSSTPEARAELLDKYASDYYGSSYDPRTPRGLDLLPPDYSKGGVMGMRPIKKRNRLMEMLDARKARRAKGGDQVINTSNTFTSELEPDDPLFQEIVQAQGPYPIGAAEVVGTPTQYEEADLAGSVLRGGSLAGREALGLVPVVGEALDLAELNKIARTGKDFYGDEADPTMYAGMTAAGMLLPNIIERPLKALGRGAKKLFKFGKKSPNPAGDKVVKKERRHSNFTEGPPAKLGKVPDDDYDAVKSIQKHVTDKVRRKGEKLDELGFDPSNLTMENIMRKGMTSKESGRHVVEVDLGNGMSQHFYLSTGLGGKTPVKGGTSKGTWVPYEGNADLGKDVIRDYKIDDWVVKGKGWDHGYGSKTMHDVSTKLSELLKDEDFVQDVLQKYYAGGVIAMRKKKRGMSPIRK